MKPVSSLVAFLEKKPLAGSLSYNFYVLYYRKVIEKEIRLANISGKDQVLNIGCGGIPFTAMQLSLLSGVRVVAIDVDEEAILAAREKIREHQLEDRVNLAVANGTGEIPFSFNVALVALQAEPKREILQNLIHRSEPGARLIFRQPRSGLSWQYDPLPPEYPVSSKVKQYQPTFTHSVLYQKEQVLQYFTGDNLDNPLKRGEKYEPVN